MHLFSLFSISAACAAVTAAQRDLPPPPDPEWALLPDKTADWYRDHGEPAPEFADDVTVVEENKSYVVKLACPGCPFLVRESFHKPSWQEQYNSLLLKFDIKEPGVDAISTLRLNGNPILPLGAMPVRINAYQVAGNLTQEVMDHMIREQMLESDFGWQTKYHRFPLKYEHTLLRTEHTGQWWVQFDVKGLQYGESGDPYEFDDEDHSLIQILISQHVNSTELSIDDIQIVEDYMRAAPIKMKCGRLAMVKTMFDPNEWDKYGRLGSWSRVGNLVFGKIGQYWEDHFQRDPLLLSLVVLLLAFGVVFACRWHQERQQEKAVDAEYALVESARDDLPPAYSDIPIIKIEEYD